jgi:hypothetical protein
MPIEYTVYGCSFKCGHRHSKSRARIERHEASCWYNTLNRTCKTCRYEEYSRDSDGFQHWWERSCNHPDSGHETGEMIEELYETLSPEDQQIPPLIGCAYWVEGRKG